MARKEQEKEINGSWSLSDIKTLISIINKNKIKEFNLKQGEMKLHILTKYHQPAGSEGSGAQPMQQVMPMMQQPVIPGVPAHPVAPAPAPAAAPAENKTASSEKTEGKKEAPEKAPEEDKNTVEVKSPMVGTFYRAPSPDSPPYVETGDQVNKDSVLCIVEAMKLMNEIKAEISGSVVDILVENGQPVEYGQPMFKIKKSL